MKENYIIHRRSVLKYKIWSLLFLCIFSTSNTIYASDEIEPIYVKNPKLFIAKIKDIGARKVIDEIFDKEPAWSWVLDQIATANDDWLEVAAMLREGTDAGASTMLRDAVNSALIISPEKVLTITVPRFEIWAICGRAEAFSSYKESIEDLEKQIKAVQSINDPKLAQKRSECLKNLEESRPALKRYFEIE